MSCENFNKSCKNSRNQPVFSINRQRNVLGEISTCLRHVVKMTVSKFLRWVFFREIFREKTVKLRKVKNINQSAKRLKNRTQIAKNGNTSENHNKLCACIKNLWEKSFCERWKKAGKRPLLLLPFVDGGCKIKSETRISGSL